MTFSSQLAARRMSFYLILKPAKKDLLHWKSKTTLSGPKASLILLINSDVEIYNSDFSTFDKVLVSDNKYHRDGKNFLVVEKDSYKGNIVTFKSCQANSAYFGSLIVCVVFIFLPHAYHSKSCNQRSPKIFSEKGVLN